MVILFIKSIDRKDIIMNTTTIANPALVSSVYEGFANYISRMSEDKVADFKKGIFSSSQKELEKLWRALDANFSVETFNNILGYNISKELFEDTNELRRYLKNDGLNDLNKIKSFVKNGNPVADEIIEWMIGLAKEQASDIARIVEARLK